MNHNTCQTNSKMADSFIYKQSNKIQYRLLLYEGTKDTKFLLCVLLGVYELIHSNITSRHHIEDVFTVVETTISIAEYSTWLCEQNN